MNPFTFVWNSFMFFFLLIVILLFMFFGAPSMKSIVNENEKQNQEMIKLICGEHSTSKTVSCN